MLAMQLLLIGQASELKYRRAVLDEIFGKVVPPVMQYSTDLIQG